MAHVSDKFLRCLAEESTNPAALDDAYQTVFGLPEAVYAQVRADDAHFTLEGVRRTFATMVQLVGRLGWPVTPREVARRAVGRFRATLPWSMHRYMNGSCEEPRVETVQARFEIVFDAGAMLWRASLDPTNGELPTNDGCAVLQLEGEDIETVLAEADLALGEAHRSTRAACLRRLADDRSSRDRRSSG